jgi:NTP pyrophosphatase (non-canonical NTP hydrolase)
MTFVYFQTQARDWAVRCFGQDIATDKLERTYRFTEESLELAQATGMTKEDVLAMVEYVYSRPPGAPAQEVGGVLVTLANLASANDISMEASGSDALEEVETRLEAIREKHKTKPIKVTL